MNTDTILFSWGIVFECLESEGILAKDTIDAIQKECEQSGRPILDLALDRGVSKCDILTALSGFSGYPFAEFDEERTIDPDVYQTLDLEKTKHERWFPFAADKGAVCVMVHQPPDQDLRQTIKDTMGGRDILYYITLPDDITRTIEHLQDINPKFPATSGRTPLARVRTWLAELRTEQAKSRTILAQGRTGLSIIRTGLAFISIGLVFFRIFGLVYLSILELALLVLGLMMVGEGLVWYWPVRKNYRKNPDHPVTSATLGTTVLELSCTENDQDYSRTHPIAGAGALRHRWNRLSPVRKRRFLAIDRTDFADERTILAHFRTLMAHTRTGLAFTRTGNAFAGLGIGLIRHFALGPWTVLDIGLIVMGVTISIEGLHWYLPGWRAGRASFRNVRKTSREQNVWGLLFNPFRDKQLSPGDLPSALSIRETYAHGIWGTTGLALERTLIAERRNVKARLRTIMARSRTGMAFIRTGASIFSVGMGLLVYFGTANPYWTCFNVFLICLSFVFFIDGLYWHVPAERIRKRFPYCYGDMELSIPDYARACRDWETLELDNEYI